MREALPLAWVVLLAGIAWYLDERRMNRAYQEMGDRIVARIATWPGGRA